MNLLREVVRGAVLLAELWIYGFAYSVARLLGGEDNSRPSGPFEKSLPITGRP